MSDLSRLPDDPALRSFAELDRAAGLPKGAHFRAFKRLGAALAPLSSNAQQAKKP